MELMRSGVGNPRTGPGPPSKITPPATPLQFEVTAIQEKY